MSDMKQIGRLAMRHEGKFWNAYYALPDSMEDAVLIGSIGFSIVVMSDEVKNAFMEIMRDAVALIIQEASGQRVQWEETVAAPEHERAGHA